MESRTFVHFSGFSSQLWPQTNFVNQLSALSIGRMRGCSKVKKILLTSPDDGIRNNKVDVYGWRSLNDSHVDLIVSSIIGQANIFLHVYFKGAVRYIGENINPLWCF